MHGAGGGAAIEGDQEAIDRPELARGDQHRAMHCAHHAFQVAAKVALGEIGMFAALADHDQPGVLFNVQQGVDQHAMALA